MLKGLIYLKDHNIDLSKKPYRHNISTLLDKASNYYPHLKKIATNSEYALLLQKFSDNFDTIRYAEGTIFLRHNNKEGWESKRPLQELSESLYDIFNSLIEAFEDVRKGP